MKPLLTTAEARAMDAFAVERLALDSLLLMENAGRGAADRILAAHRDALAHVVLLGGIGQNGGDAWVVARHLALAGVRTTSILVAPPEREPAGDAARNLATLRAMGSVVERFDPASVEPHPALDDASLVVDGLFGTGLSRALDASFVRTIDALNARSVPVVSLDLPSGIAGDTGEDHGAVVQAVRTITFGHAKRGLYQRAGAIASGAIDVVSIGSPLPTAPNAYLLEASDLGHFLEPRPRDAHKGTAGHVLVVVGREGTIGASLLAARGAARAGAGLVTLAARPSVRPAIDARVLESMTAGFATADELRALARGKRAIVVGPGLGRDDDARAVVEALAFDTHDPVVLDADALTILGPHGLDRLASANGPRIVTPHPGEAATLLGTDRDAIQRDRHAAARSLADRGRCTVVLKGMGSIVATPGEPDFVCPHGTSAMGTGGTGDVLAGVVGAVVDRDRVHSRVAAAVLLHALAGEEAARADRGLLAGELADAIPTVLGHAVPRR